MSYMQYIMWNMKIGMVSFFSCESYGLPSHLHSHIANIFHVAGTYLECRLNDALSIVTPTL